MQTRVVDLTPESIVSNARYWGGEEQVPRQALHAAWICCCLRAGHFSWYREHKHQILHRAIAGPQTPEVSASFLQSALNVTVLADRAAWQGQ